MNVAVLYPPVMSMTIARILSVPIIVPAKLDLLGMEKLTPVSE